MTIEVIAQKRDDQGSGASRRLRRAGQVPGVIYGNGEAKAISLDHNTLFYALKDDDFHGSVLNMIVDGAAEQVILRDVQQHAYKQQVLHADFQRVEANVPLTAKVRLSFINADISPAVKLGGKLMSRIVSEVQVVALPANLPSSLVVDLSTLQAGEAIHLSDLKLPEGAELASLRRGHDLAVARA